MAFAVVARKLCDPAVGQVNTTPSTIQICFFPSAIVGFHSHMEERGDMQERVPTMRFGHSGFGPPHWAPLRASLMHRICAGTDGGA